MNERMKRDVVMFLVVLISCLIFVAAVETFTGLLSETRERNLSNQKNIDSILDILKTKGDESVKSQGELLRFYDDFLFEDFL